MSACVFLPLGGEDALRELVAGERPRFFDALGWRIGDVTEVWSRAEKPQVSLASCTLSGRAALISVASLGIFMSNSSLIGSLVSAVEGT